MARIGAHERDIWFRTDAAVMPNADAALAACLLPAMRFGGRLAIDGAISPRLLRGQREFQSVQQAWSRTWPFDTGELREVEVVAPPREPPAATPGRGVGAFFSGGVDSSSTVLENPDITHVIFGRGLDLALDNPRLADAVEGRLRTAAAELGLAFVVVETNLRELSDPLIAWDTYFASGLIAIAHLLAPLFDRVLIPMDLDHELQVGFGANLRVAGLLGTEHLQLVEDGGRYNREEKLARIAHHPVMRRTLRVCWENRHDAYNCGRCRKCLMTQMSLEALGVREEFVTFPPDPDLEAVNEISITHVSVLDLWLDVLDTTRRAGRPDLERIVQRVVERGRAACGLPAGARRRAMPGPAPTVRIGVVIPVHGQPQFLAGAVESALRQDVDVGIGVVVVDDGCPFPSTRAITAELRDAHRENFVSLHQDNRGVCAARNTGNTLAFERWPEIEAIFQLDGDNLLSPHTLCALWELLEAHPEVDWVSPQAELTGGEEGTWYVPGSFLTYRQLFDNQSDTGSLVRRRVFEALAYDETMSGGYTDWEFFLRASLAGFRGMKAGECGFRYRRRRFSMVADAQDEAPALRAAIRARNAQAYTHRALVEREHEEAPRFALACTDSGDVLLTAACDLEPRRRAWSEHARAVDACGGGAWETDELIPAITVVATEPLLRWLAGRRLLAGALFRLQVELGGHEVVALHIGGLVALAARTRTVHLRGGEDLQPDGVVELQLGEAAPALSPGGLPGLGTGNFTGLPAYRELSHSQRFAQLHIDELDTTLPWRGSRGTRSVLLIVPWWRVDGTHRGAVELLRAARSLDPAIELHLALTDDDDLRDVPFDAFETVTPVGDERALVALMAGSDVVVHAGPPRNATGPLHVVLAGGAADAATARHLDANVDVYIAPTRSAALRLANHDAVPDKITLAPAATVLRPAEPERARLLARAKNRRDTFPAVLFHGPADLGARLGVRFTERVTADTLENADVAVFAGLTDPTLALDAMSFGCAVIAVGPTGLDDLVVDGETGLVVDPPDAFEAIRDIAAQARVRSAGVELALNTSWAPAAQAFLDALHAAATRSSAATA